MKDVLRGNFKPKDDVVVEEQKQTLEDQFERAAKARLGGSIAYVSKKRVTWNEEDGKK